MQLDVTNKPMVERALGLATAHHAGIKRKYCGTPYISHPIRVAENLLKYGFTSEEILSAALLHDCLEDENVYGATMDSYLLESHTSQRVLRWVRLLTNTETGNRAQRKAAAALRIQTSPIEVQAIKLCDILDNCTGIAAQDPGFAEVYIQEKQALVKGLRPNEKLSRLVGDVSAVLSAEMNSVAVWHLQTRRAEHAKIVARDEEIATIIAGEERSVFADIALF